MSEAFSAFIENLAGDDEEFCKVMHQNSLLNHAVNHGFRSGMSEIEVLRSVVLAAIKISDAETERKIHEMMLSPSPVYKGGYHDT